MQTPAESGVTVGDIIRRLSPCGSGHRADAVIRANDDAAWAEAPWWPPDMFCLVASVVERAGCYANLGVTFGKDEAKMRKRAAHLRRVGDAWRKTGAVPAEVRRLWTQLWRARRSRIWTPPGANGAPATAIAGWELAALSLMSIADEACRSLGFAPVEGEHNEPGRVFLHSLVPVQRGEEDRVLHLPFSLCRAVPPDLACVLPKSLTPEVGCTLRSLSLNLGLLPGRGVVGAEWYIATRFLRSERKGGGRGKAVPQIRDDDFNLLLVPFPFEVEANDFSVVSGSAGGRDRLFQVTQGWLPRERATEQVIELVRTLIRHAERYEHVHAVVLPEAALADGMADSLARTLAAESDHLQLIICGQLTSSGGVVANEAAVIRLDRGEVTASLVQKKHHRWRVTPSQARQYRLQQVMGGDYAWWEEINVADRVIQLGINKQEAVVAALVCEDLARFDPVLPALNAVGPNLVIGLLMDGPQLLARWPARYATVLADDPGSSVLTLTNLGMLERCRRPNEPVNRCIALWKDAEGDPRELFLPEGAHALLLSLRTVRKAQTTLDMRTGGHVVTYRFGGVREVKLRRDGRFDWLQRDPGEEDGEVRTPRGRSKRHGKVRIAASVNSELLRLLETMRRPPDEGAPDGMWQRAVEDVGQRLDALPRAAARRARTGNRATHHKGR